MQIVFTSKLVNHYPVCALLSLEFYETAGDESTKKNVRLKSLIPPAGILKRLFKTSSLSI